MTSACPKEKKKQSKHSPSVVADSEELVFALLEPYNFQHSEILNKAFSRTELRETRVSVSRKDHTNRLCLQEEVIDALIKKDPKRKFVGTLTSLCKAVRNLKSEDNKRAFCVIDDGTEENPGHAHIGFAHEMRKSLQTQNRENLLNEFDSKNIKTLDQTYPN